MRPEWLNEIRDTNFENAGDVKTKSRIKNSLTKVLLDLSATITPLLSVIICI